jgi:hypothetical protein
MIKWVFIPLFFIGCAHNQKTSIVESQREPAQVIQPEKISFLCKLRGGGDDQESFQLSATGEVKYDLLTNKIPMEGRGPIAASWISKNVVVLSGRWLTDIVCGPPSSCEFHYFSIHLHKTGAGLEITTHYRHPESIWRLESTPLNCRVSQ